MKINEIRDVLKQDIGYYKCILINGNWGIGKTYEINKIKCDRMLRNKIIITTLFGKSSIEKVKNEVYQKTNGISIYIIFIITILLFSFLQVLPIKVNEVSPLEALEIIKHGILPITLIYYIAKIISFIGTLIFGFFITRDNFSKVFFKIRKTRRNVIIVFDDFERMSPSIKITEILGFIEELKSLGYSVIVISDESKIKNKEEFEEFKEKIVDKTYNVVENEQDAINILTFNGIEIDDETKKNIYLFIKNHDITNLRTIQKANKFIKQVIKNIKIKDDNIKTDIISGCIAICSEYNDKLYLYRERENYGKLEEQKVKETNEDNFRLDIKMEETKECIDNVVYRIVSCYNLKKELVEWLNDTYIGKCKINNKELFNSYTKNILEIEPFYILNNYLYELEDDEIIDNMQKILDNIEECIYDISEYPIILSLFIRIKNMGFDKLYLEKCITTMERNIDKCDCAIYKFNNFNINLEEDRDIIEYKDIISNLEKKLIHRYQEEINRKANSIIKKEDGWGIEFKEYYENNNLINEKSLIKLIDIDNLVDVIKYSKPKDIRDFGKELNNIYGYQNVKDLYEADLDTLNELYNKLSSIDTSTFGISKKYNINFLIESTDKIIKRLT